MTQKGKKERLMAIIIGIVMIGSMAGFALSSMVYLQPPAQQEEMPTVVDRILTPEEKRTVLMSGMVLIEDLYQSNCTECLELNMFLTSFAEAFEGYAVLEKAVANETKAQMIGNGGKIRDIEPGITQEEMMDIFCELAIKQPRECLLMDI